jgi:hypothetical protein
MVLYVTHVFLILGYNNIFKNGICGYNTHNISSHLNNKCMSHLDILNDDCLLKIIEYLVLEDKKNLYFSIKHLSYWPICMLR